MKNVLITGATGMIGGIVLREYLNSPNIEKVTSISRRPTGVSHPKLVEVIHKNFSDFTGLEEHFTGQDIAQFCIGVYTGQVPDAQFRTITVDYTVAFATLLKQLSPGATLCFLSGSGADRTEKSSMSFAKYKGIAENFLIKTGFSQLYIFRPAYIYPVEKREEPNFTYRLSRMLYPLLKTIYSKGVITSETLGRAMYTAGLSGAKQMTLENQDIKAVGT